MMLRWVTVRNGVHVAAVAAHAAYVVVESAGRFEVTYHWHDGVMDRSVWLGQRDSVIEAGKLAQEEYDE